MRVPRSSGRSPGRRLDLKILAWALCACLILGSINLLEPVELFARTMRDKLRSHAPSGQVVIVEIDDKSLRAIGPLPWPRRRYADLIERLHAAGARRIALDFAAWPQQARDPYFDLALRRAERTVILPMRFDSDAVTARQTLILPDAHDAADAQVAYNGLMLTYGGMIYDSPYAVEANGRVYPSLASLIGGRAGAPETYFPIDYATNAAAFPVVSAHDILSDKWDASLVAGRDVVVGDTSTSAARYGVPGLGQMQLAFIHAAAIESLREGKPIDIGWLLPMLAAFVAAAAYLRVRNRYLSRGLLSFAFAALAFGTLAAEHAHIYLKILPALALLAIVSIARRVLDLRQSFRTKGLINPVSGQPNLNALREAASRLAPTVVVARLLNYAEVTTSLPADSEKELVEQIVNRLSVGASGDTVYQADDGLFIWIAEAENEERVGEQLMALHALFRSPVVVAGRLIDLSVTFGLDNDASRSLVQRVSSAVVAADRAAAEGRRWMTYDPAELEDAEWKMSLLARLDQAVEHGEIWVAYQPKIELATGRIIGAEALARWSHFEKGEIPPSQFIPAAERSGRIENLTAHILDVAVAAAASIRRAGHADFGIAVNLSARLLDSPGLLAMVTDTIARHQLPPRSLILEITETTAMASEDDAFDALEALSALGVRLSIDDYGTGFSTLDYLKRIPADEIKIDRSFITMLEKSQSDRIMVHSTIQLAHSLGRRVVAEGVENGTVLNELRAMRCDYVQGYHTGRPMKLDAFLQALPQRETVVVA